MDKNVTSVLPRVAGALAAAALALAASGACAQPIAAGHSALRMAGEVILGGASFYDTPGEETASGEQYDPALFTAAAQLEIRDKFGGIKFGRLYQPVYAIAEYAGKRALLKFNDVGPLRPGRKFDLSRAAMEHFGGIERGVLAEFKVVLLPPGEDYKPGPLPDVEWTPMEANGEPLMPVRNQEIVVAAASRTGNKPRSCVVGSDLLALRIDMLSPSEVTLGDVMIGGLASIPRRQPMDMIAKLGD